MRHFYLTYSSLHIYKKYILYLILLLAVAAEAQERKPVKGLVYAGNAGIADVLVVNFTGQSETRTDNTGRFTLSLQVGDLIIISGSSIETKKIRFTPDLINNSLLQLEVALTGEVLEEVVINRSRVSSESLGIPMGKKYTPAERRLRTASNLDPTLGAGTMTGFSVSFDAILNAINGRTARLKKEVAIEKKEFALQKLNGLYTDDFYIEKYGLKAEQVNGFKYFAVENEEFVAILNGGNTTQTEFGLTLLAEQYIERSKNEK
ncbi:hypothetical protein CHU92_02310 [Flavobacterium cyanobacteriorum]|uniref:Uncharacterized protein n=2 Tax=Flavobacterium cyanobacteriorum TaxID=2022802 RepID=A0A255ZTV0_9FLAO|nr:hypothetical protein CHU92_02310 [Flavobacterium cyanobacteriorum]